jgi:hypothetical protein
VHSSSSLGIEFRYPSRFLIGKYKKEELIERMKGLDIDSSFNNAIVLIEPKQLREFPLMDFLKRSIRCPLVTGRFIVFQVILGRMVIRPFII